VDVPRAVRPERTSGEPTPHRRPAGAGRDGAVVAVTGAATGLGAAVVAQLRRLPRVGRVVGVDATIAAEPAGDEGTVAELTWHALDPVDPRLTTAFDGVDAVVHLAVDLMPDRDRTGQRQRNTRAAQTVLTAAFAAGVRQVVLVTSAMVYGARADNPVPLPDDAPLRAVPEANAVGDLLEVERNAAQARRTHRGLRVAVLRPAVVLGAGDREPLAALLSAPRLLRIRGVAGHWQFCHLADLAAAVEIAALDGFDGAANVGCEGWLDAAELEHVTGRRGLELPERVALGSAERLHRLGLTPAPPSELAYLIHPWVVDTARLRAAGWKPSYTNAEAVRRHLADLSERDRPRLDPKAATAATAAAGAAVALVGTAALVRRARRRRRG
jgi:nucleoside-diphosphate-sugar epimerase